MFADYEAVIGLEIHAQLATDSKIFCRDSTHFGAGDNENTCPICVGMPGTLPTINRRAVEYAIKAGLALGCQIREKSVFARKQYFYPDLPKGYQISQFDQPLCEDGRVEFFHAGTKKAVRITRAHMEEDAGKSIHHGDSSLINLNRAGVPLLEIVSDPDLRSAEEAAEYARAVRQILRCLQVCDGNLEEGSLRCDCNVSVRRRGTEKLGTKVEIKNINSFRFIEKAIDHEVQRQIDCLESGEKILQETRLYDPDKNRTFSMRSKEEAHDYRYFPDPDLLPLHADSAWVQGLRGSLPELPLPRAQRFVQQYQLPEYDAGILTQERELADYFENVAKTCGNAKAASNWVMTELMRELGGAKKSVVESPIDAMDLGRLIAQIEQGKISGKIAKVVFAEMWQTGASAEEIIQKKGLVQINDASALESIIEQVIAAHPAQVAEYRGGREKVFGFFVGQAMKATKGQANPDLLNEILKKKLQG